MRRIEATAIYATVMVALLASAALHSGVVERVVGYLPSLRAQNAPVVMVTSSGLTPAVLQAKLAVANAKCIREQQVRMALDQAKIARDLALEQTAQAKLAAAHYRWQVKSAMANSDDVQVVVDTDQNDNY